MEGYQEYKDYISNILDTEISNKSSDELSELKLELSLIDNSNKVSLDHLAKRLDDILSRYKNGK